MSIGERHRTEESIRVFLGEPVNETMETLEY
jgi:hypothetical protein